MTSIDERVRGGKHRHSENYNIKDQSSYVLDNFHPLEGLAVVDYGAGYGRLSEPISNWSQVTRVDAVEIDDKQLRSLESKSRGAPKICPISAREFFDRNDEPIYGGSVIWRVLSRVVYPSHIEDQLKGANVVKRCQLESESELYIMDNILDKMSRRLANGAPLIGSVRNKRDRFYGVGERVRENTWVTHDESDFSGVKVYSEKDLKEGKYHIPRYFFDPEDLMGRLKHHGFITLRIDPIFEQSGNGYWANDYLAFVAVRDRRSGSQGIENDRRRILTAKDQRKFLKNFRQREYKTIRERIAFEKKILKSAGDK